jgi:hypothetical protein
MAYAWSDENVCYGSIRLTEKTRPVPPRKIVSPLSPQIRSKLDQVADRFRPNLRGEGS